MIKGVLVVVVLLGLSAFSVDAGVEEGVAAMNRGDYTAAYMEFLPLAEGGDDVSMITIGTFYYMGQGFQKDYGKAMEWYLKAFEKGNGDAFSNIGVMYRDGSGVTKNKKMAYCLFLITHMRGLGTDDTQIRAGSCLNRLVPTMTKEELVEIFNYTEEYIVAYVKSKGTLKGVPEKYAPSKERVKLKDKDWWLPGELAFLEG